MSRSTSMSIKTINFSYKSLNTKIPLPYHLLPRSTICLPKPLITILYPRSVVIKTTKCRSKKIHSTKSPPCFPCARHMRWCFRPGHVPHTYTFSLYQRLRAELTTIYHGNKATKLPPSRRHHHHHSYPPTSQSFLFIPLYPVDDFDDNNKTAATHGAPSILHQKRWHNLSHPQLR